MELLNNNEPDNNNNNYESKYYCYIIKSTNPAFPNSTYNGSTNNLVRRLRQHNGEIVGGAKATRGKGPWVYFCVWEGFQTHREALSCEWRIKHPTNTKKRPAQFNGVKGRIKSLSLLVGLDNWTNQSGGMSSGLDYNLWIQDDLVELVGLVEPELKKPNLAIKKLSQFVY